MSVMLMEDVKDYVKVANSFIKFKKNLEGHMWSTNKSYDEVYNLTYFLYLANVESYNSLYKDDKAEEIYTREQFVKYLDRHPVESYDNIYQYLKSLEFLEYQIEIDNNKNGHIYEALKFLKATIAGITSYIVSQHEEYNNAKWGL